MFGPLLAVGAALWGAKSAHDNNKAMKQQHLEAERMRNEESNRLKAIQAKADAQKKADMDKQSKMMARSNKARHGGGFRDELEERLGQGYQLPGQGFKFK